MTSSMKSVATEETDAKDPSTKDAEPTIPNATESGVHTIITDSAIPQDSIDDEAHQLQKIGTPGMPDFTKKPPRISDSIEPNAAADSTIQLQGSTHLKLDAITKFALANNLAFMSFPPEKSPDSVKPAAATSTESTTAPEEPTTTSAELPPEHK